MLPRRTRRQIALFSADNRRRDFGRVEPVSAGSQLRIHRFTQPSDGVRGIRVRKSGTRLEIGGESLHHPPQLPLEPLDLGHCSLLRLVATYTRLVATYTRLVATNAWWLQTPGATNAWWRTTSLSKNSYIYIYIYMCLEVRYTYIYVFLAEQE